MNLLAIAALAGVLLGGAGSWLVTDSLCDARILSLEKQKAEEAELAWRLSVDRLSIAQAKGDALSNQLAKTEVDLIQTTQELHRALSKTTTNKPCLNSATVRLLNRNAQADHPTVPKTARPSAAESTAIATDTDIAGWIGGAQWQYATCRARLNALIDFNN